MRLSSARKPRKKKRLLVLASTFPRWKDDTEPRFVLDLSNHLAKTFDVTVLAPFSPGSSASEKLEHVHVRRFKYALFDAWSILTSPGSIMGNLKRKPWLVVVLPWFFLFQILAIRKELLSQRYDAIHAHWLIPQAISLLIARWFVNSPPYVVTVHGGDAAVGRLFGISTLSRAALNAAYSSTVVAEHLKKKLPACQFVAPMGVDLYKFGNIQGRGKPRLVFVGRLAKKKGVDILLGASKLLPDDLEIHIIGDGEERSHLEQMTSRAFFAGALTQSEIVKYLQLTDIICLPFRDGGLLDSDGTPTVLLEMAAAGLAIIASDIEAIDQTLSNGAVKKFEAENVDALVSAIKDLLADEGSCKEQIRLAKIEVERFKWSAVGDVYTDLMMKAAEEVPSSKKSNNSGQ